MSDVDCVNSGPKAVGKAGLIQFVVFRVSGTRSPRMSLSCPSKEDSSEGAGLVNLVEKELAELTISLRLLDCRASRGSPGLPRSGRLQLSDGRRHLGILDKV